MVKAAMHEVTQLLDQIQQGDPSAASQLAPLVYDELRRLAAAQLAGEKPGQTPMQPHWCMKRIYA